MDIKKFEDITLVTSTQILYLNGNININNLNWFMPLKGFKLTKEESLKLSKKKKLSTKDLPVGQNGDIMSLRYLGISRGTVSFKKPHEQKKEPFKHCITLDITVNGKNINSKISEKIILCTGCKTMEHGKETAKIIIDHIYNIQKKIVFKGDEKENLLKLSDKLKIMLGKIESDKKEKLKKTEIEEIYTACYQYIPCLNNVLRNWLEVESIENIICFADMLTLIDPTKFNVCKGNLEFRKIRIPMINYNYKLNIKVNRDFLRKELSKYDIFKVRYEKIKDTSVVVESPYEKEYDPDDKKKKGIPHHTFRIYKSGTVVQSSPGRDITEKIYYKFMNILKEISEMQEYNLGKRI